MKVLESRVSHPMNAIGGLYVQLEGNRDDVYGDNGIELAMQEAEKKGYNPDGEASMGIPVSKGLRTYTRSYWFYDRLA